MFVILADFPCYLCPSWLFHFIFSGNQNIISFFQHSLFMDLKLNKTSVFNLYFLIVSQHNIELHIQTHIFSVFFY